MPNPAIATNSAITNARERSHVKTTRLAAEFAGFLASLWVLAQAASPREPKNHVPGMSVYSHTLFRHEYEITPHPAWDTWKSGNTSGTPSQQPGFYAPRQKRWWCESLCEAEKHYSWTTALGTFADLANRLQAAIARGDILGTHSACMDIFAFGGVALDSEDRSRLWVNARRDDGSLFAKIQEACDQLDPDCSGPLTAFNTGTPMNSAMTKIYAAAAPHKLVIYDGRVGAALCLLAREFLTARERATIPMALSFLWGPARGEPTAKRDPSRKPFKFLSLYNIAIGDYERAQTARRANAILREVVSRLAAAHVTLSMLERALFMIGYDVR